MKLERQYIPWLIGRRDVVGIAETSKMKNE